MDNAVYAATTGLLNRQRALDVTGNNLANASTSGFKRDTLITTTFGEYVAYRMINSTQDDEIGTTTHGCIADELYTDYSQGTIEGTGRGLDYAILGDGFFSIQAANGRNGLTRNGSFQVNALGYLVTSAGDYVLGRNGRLFMGPGEVLISEGGEVSCAGRYVDTLQMVVPNNMDALNKRENNTVNNPGGNANFTGRILSGHLERSNVDMIVEMSDMMQASRAFQSCGQALRILDLINQKTVNEIGRV